MDTKNKIFWKDFIEVYRNHSCLWDIQSADYMNQAKRTQSYKVLLNKLREINSYATIDCLKKKINNIRTSFRREYKKVQDSKKFSKGADEIYQPSLWYYRLLLFTLRGDDITNNNLHDFEDFDQEIDSNHYIDIYEEEHCEDPLLTPVNESKSFITLTENISSPQTSISPSHTINNLVQRKRRRQTNNSCDEKEQLLDSVYNDVLIKEDDECTVIGKRIAFQLKAMDQHQKIIAEKLVSDIMFYGNLGKLTEYARVNCYGEN